MGTLGTFQSAVEGGRLASVDSLLQIVSSESVYTPRSTPRLFRRVHDHAFYCCSYFSAMLVGPRISYPSR